MLSLRMEDFYGSLLLIVIVYCVNRQLQLSTMGGSGFDRITFGWGCSEPVNGLYLVASHVNSPMFINIIAANMKNSCALTKII